MVATAEFAFTYAMLQLWLAACDATKQRIPMTQAAHSENDEYWRPANPATARLARPILAEGLCPACGAEYPARALFCHICGKQRHPDATRVRMTFSDFFDVAAIRRRYGLSVSSFVFFVLGIVCLAIALAVGISYKADTLAEWQAMQAWRIEWLLGATAAMLAGILLKK
ncbi:MAG: zinc ribbon domain-containing protein [Candidatus Korobacteraceae bacterium]